MKNDQQKRGIYMRGNLTLNDSPMSQFQGDRIAAEKYFYELNEPHYHPEGFNIFRRNDYHFDVVAKPVAGRVSAFYAYTGKASMTTGTDFGTERAFAIRGELGKVYLRDERWNPFKPHPRRDDLTFTSITAALVHIGEIYLREPNI